jgi:ABC-type phosphate transport system substrate-binding protein
MSGRARIVRRALLAALWLALGFSEPRAAGGPGLAVIVHPTRTDAFDEETLRLVYLKQRRYWSDGSPIVPVNRDAGSVERAAFNDRVIRMPPARLAAFWNERYFEGVFPPITLSSNLAVVRYVARERSAVGYVGLDALDDSVRVVLRLE